MPLYASLIKVEPCRVFSADCPPIVAVDLSDIYRISAVTVASCGETATDISRAATGWRRRDSEERARYPDFSSLIVVHLQTRLSSVPLSDTQVSTLYRQFSVGTSAPGGSTASYHDNGLTLSGIGDAEGNDARRLLSWQQQDQHGSAAPPCPATCLAAMNGRLRQKSGALSTAQTV